MSTPDAEDASPSPEYTGELDDEMAAEQSNERQNSRENSPSQKNATDKAASTAKDAKDPNRPRRKKARRACFACQRAHLTCGDERPCNRCVKRGLQEHCMDGVRKKAKYLHDAPDGALMPGVGGHYPYMNGNRPTPLPSQDTQNVPVPPQTTLFSQAPQASFYPPNSLPGPIPSNQDAPFNQQQSPISPQFSQGHHSSVSSTAPTTMSQAPPAQMQQFGGPLFDPSDPALFNFDISNLNFGNHYGALEFGMLGHMSSGVNEQQDGARNSMSQAGMYHGMPSSFSDQSTPTMYGQNGMPLGDWQDAQSRQGSMQVQTPTTSTPAMDHMDHRHDSLNGPHAFAIGQGPGSHSTASPASTDASAFEADNPLSSATFFANANRPQRSPVANRPPQDSRLSTHALQPIHSNGVRKKNRDTKSIYSISKPYDYVKGYHKLYTLITRKYSKAWVAKAQEYLQNYRPVLLQVREELSIDDLIHQEQNLQRLLTTQNEHISEVGVPSIMCRRSGEVVGLNKEFTILTGWKREVLLGAEPNLNVNVINRDASNSEFSTQNTTPNLTAQDEPRSSTINIIELMDPRSALEFLQKFSELCYQDPHGHAHDRVQMMRYQTKADFDRIQEMKATQEKSEPVIKTEGGVMVHQGESAMGRLGAKNGMIDCMIRWHIKRDIFDMPLLVCMSIMPVLDRML